MPGRSMVFALFLAALSLGVILCPGTAVASPRYGSGDGRVDIGIVILSAYYADVDGDGYEDDVVAHFDIYLSGSWRYHLGVYLSLTLPSGTTYIYGFGVITTLSVIHCTTYFYDHAVESGWYSFSVVVVSYSGGSSYWVEEYVFDPPGGYGDQDPCGALVVVSG